jgi:hypothetical protein
MGRGQNFKIHVLYIFGRSALKLPQLAAAITPRELQQPQSSGSYNFLGVRAAAS